MKAGTISMASTPNIKFRIDASYHLSDGTIVKNTINKSPYRLLQIKDTTDRIFYGGRAKRVYVSRKENGLYFLSSSDILQTNLEAVKLASKKYMPDVDGMKLEKGWILITRSGTIGNTAWANAQHAQKLASEDVIRLVPNNILRGGFVYAYLSCSYGHSLLTQGTFGAVIQHIEPNFVGSLPIPVFPQEFQDEVDMLIQFSATLREEATSMLKTAEALLKQKAGLRELNPDDYDYFGHHSAERKVSCFIRNIKDIGTTTINAFNHSERIRALISSIPCTTRPLKEVLQNGQTFSTGSFPRIEVKKGCGIMLINQSDIFDSIIKGKYISMRNVKISNLVEYGEILIAGVGTLGESETFCRAIFANEDLQGQLVSGEFIRMKTTEDMPSGYLFAWLNTDYGFRLIRNTQAGTKLCRPILRLFIEIPVPIIDTESMLEIDRLVREAHTKRHEANVKELKAIKMVEDEIEKWNK
jgi:hypothetical protein